MATFLPVNLITGFVGSTGFLLSITKLEFLAEIVASPSPLAATSLLLLIEPVVFIASMVEFPVDLISLLVI